VRYAEISPGRVRLRTGASAPLEVGSARVSVLGCGVCGTDLHALRGMVLPRGVDYPLRPGHEVVGTVTELAGDTDGPSVGETVVLHPLAPCGDCAACARGEEQLCARGRALGFHDPGGLADEVVWPAARMVEVGGLPPEQAALLADAVATAYHALRCTDLPPGGSLCVLGAGGLGGQVLRLVRVLDPQARVAAVVRRESTAELVEALGGIAVRGLDDAVGGVREAIGPADAVVDFTGDETAAATGLRMLRAGGSLVVGSVVDKPIQLGTSVTGLTAREMRVRGAYVSTMDELRTVTSLARAGKLDLSGAVSHVLALEQTAEALRLLEERPSGLQRIVVRPEGDS
jgi:2-desacetyl-2-hydroxyethyl bacteriochlorophyllide A dehydrogenase